MAKKLKTVIGHCGECPYMFRDSVIRSQSNHYCGLDNTYVSMNVYNKTINDNCKLEEN